MPFDDGARQKQPQSHAMGAFGGAPGFEESSSGCKRHGMVLTALRGLGKRIFGRRPVRAGGAAGDKKEFAAALSVGPEIAAAHLLRPAAGNFPLPHPELLLPARLVPQAFAWSHRSSLFKG